MALTKKKTDEVGDVVFSKEQLIKSNKYKGIRDTLNVILDDGEKYSIEDVEQKIKEFKKVKVK